MTRRLLAIAAIFLCTTFAWVLLGTTVFVRSETSSRSLSGRVASTWGTVHIPNTPLRSPSKRKSPSPPRLISPPGCEPSPVPCPSWPAGSPLDSISTTAGRDWCRFSTFTVDFRGDFSFKKIQRTNRGKSASPFPFPRKRPFTTDWKSPRTAALWPGAALRTEPRPKPGFRQGEPPFSTPPTGARAWIPGVTNSGEKVADVRDFQLTMTQIFRPSTSP